MSKHGGDIYRNKVNMDFSVNLSPYGMPPKVRAALTRSLLYTGVYPDVNYSDLKRAIARAEGVEAEQIVCGNGASELIYAAARTVCRLAPKAINVGIFNPCFAEYKKAFDVAGVKGYTQIYLKEENDFIPELEDIEFVSDFSDAVILGNPNNPTGRLIPIDVVRKALEIAEKKGTYLILDESFLSLVSNQSEYIKEYKKIDSDRIIRIKSFTKCMAMPGVRLGYAICKDKGFKAEMEKQLPEWNVSVSASMAGVEASEAFNWLNEQFLDEENGLDALKSQLADGLVEAGIKVFDSDTVFLLIKSDETLYQKLLEKNILIRDCANFDGLKKGFFRVAVKNRDDNARLIAAINDEKCQKEDDITLMQVLPEDIEKRSFEIITTELLEKGINLDEDKAPVIKRCIHTSADFEYANSLVFSENAIDTIKKLIREGAHIVTDTNMALSGINKTELAKYGGEAHCFMADSEIAKKAKEMGCTRATMSMKHAATMKEKIIFAIGNAPTALVTLCELMDKEGFKPEFVIGVPVGFVNVEPAKEMIISRNIPHIVNRGRKGGSNVAAAIVNAILYEMRKENCE